MTIPRQICILGHHMRTGHISPSMGSKRVAEVGEVLLERQLVCCTPTTPSGSNSAIGRVAAGAIAEKYLKLAHGIEIVAFVSSVGKIHMPSCTISSTSEDEDHVDDVLSPEYINILRTVTREQVDEDITRCPHIETREKMRAVGFLDKYLTRSDLP